MMRMMHASQRVLPGLRVALPGTSWRTLYAQQRLMEQSVRPVETSDFSIGIELQARRRKRTPAGDWEMDPCGQMTDLFAAVLPLRSTAAEEILVWRSELSPQGLCFSLSLSCVDLPEYPDIFFGTMHDSCSLKHACI